MNAASSRKDLWSLQPVRRPEPPRGIAKTNPIDAFAQAMYTKKGLRPAAPADRASLLRRVYLDLTGLLPTPEDLMAFVNDSSPDAYERVVDRLLSSEQHGVRYARHWLDVLRYTDLDSHMPLGRNGIHLWREWVISALNRDVPYDRFVRAQILGDQSDKPDELFATGFLARGAQSIDNKDQELAFSAVETISTAFLGMTVGCARCHNHMFDPISQRDFYAMKALFDPLTLEQKTLATSEQIVAYTRAKEAYEAKKAELEAPLNELVGPFRKRLFDERVAMLPPDVQVVMHKPEAERTPEERKIADDYAPVVRIDTSKILEVMTPEQKARHKELRAPLAQLKEPPELPIFWTIREDPKRMDAKSHILQSGDPEMPKEEVQPGFPLSPEKVDFTRGRRQAFVDWLTGANNPLFARVAVNRLWQWHFGDGLVASVSDFGSMGDKPVDAELLDWLASEFAAKKYSMKAMHRLIVTSDLYKMGSTPDAATVAANTRIDPTNKYLWKYPLRRLEAEVVHDGIYSLAGNLDTSVGGKSYRVGPEQFWTGSTIVIGDWDTRTNRRGAYMARGFHGDVEMLPAFLQVFDAEDGRRVCPKRTHTVTAPQALTMMNSPAVIEEAHLFGDRLRKESGGDTSAAIRLGYLMALARGPKPDEVDVAQSYVRSDPKRLDGFAWMLLNLDEFIYIK